MVLFESQMGTTAHLHVHATVTTQLGAIPGAMVLPGISGSFSN
jgi:hypothetical protein